MGLLDNVERGLEKLVSGAFSKRFRGGVQPIEIVAALKRDVDSRAVVVQRDRILAPHSFTVGLSSDDFEQLNSHGAVLIAELVTAVRDYAERQRYSFAAPVTVGLVAAADIPNGTVRIASQPLDAVSSWQPALEFNGDIIKLNSAESIIGRGSTAHVVLEDTGASRHHARILWNGKTAGLEDLKSTNGTFLNSKRITASPLEHGDVVGVGSARLIFRILPGDKP